MLAFHSGAGGVAPSSIFSSSPYHRLDESTYEQQGDCRSVSSCERAITLTHNRMFVVISVAEVSARSCVDFALSSALTSSSDSGGPQSKCRR